MFPLLLIFLDDDDEIERDFISFGLPRQIYTRSNYFLTLDEIGFQRRFRLTKEAVLFTLDLIEEDLEHPTDLNGSMSPLNQFLTFLRFCATAKHFISVGDYMGCHLSTVCRIVRRVARAICFRCKHFIRLPQTEAQMSEEANNFYNVAKFPRVIGLIDCTHIKIQSLGGDNAEVFRNRKGFFSLNVQVICNASLSITNVVARWPGSTHDATVFINSRVHAEFESRKYTNYLLLGDSGYPALKYLLTPLLNPHSEIEQLYNESHIRTRNGIERCFGVLKRRFPILAYGIRLKNMDTIMAVITSTCILHNIAIMFNEDTINLYPEENAMNFELLIHNANNINGNDNRGHEDDVNGVNQRSHLINNYFGRL